MEESAAEHASGADVYKRQIKKFNQALLYCQQGSEDLAIIQLKKVLSMSPKLVKGHQLMALLYMKGEEYGKAKKACLLYTSRCV